MIKANDMITATISWTLSMCQVFYVHYCQYLTSHTRWILNDLLEAKQLAKLKNYDFSPIFSDFKVLLFLPFHTILFILLFIEQELI